MKVLIDGVTGETTPPTDYGGIERVNTYLVKGLQELGVDVKFMCREGSTIDCDKICFPFQSDPRHIVREAENRWGKFDVYHDSSCGGLMYKAFKRDKATFWTVHGIGGDGDLCAYLTRGSMKLSPSTGGELPYTQLGINLDMYDPCYEKEDYILFIGQAIRHRKYFHYFLEIAREFGLRAIAIIPPKCVNSDYFNECSSIYPFAWIRGANDETKLKYLSRAKALIHCSNEGEGDGWQDASPVAVLESLAVGTPVIGNYSGGIPEMIIPGSTGYLVHNVSEAIEAYRRIDDIVPQSCRVYMENNRTHVIFAKRMLALYEAAACHHYNERYTAIRSVQSRIDSVTA
jgi:glycosyltransferase involved in cell wall biosynthesis